MTLRASHRLSIACALAALVACQAEVHVSTPQHGPARPLQIRVDDDGFSVGGQVLRTRSELTEAIRASGATECHVIPSAHAAYKQVEAAVVAQRDAGCRSGIVGNMQR